MDELNQDPDFNHQTNPPSAELTLPMEGEQSTPISEVASSQSEVMPSMPENTSAISIPPTVVKATSGLSFIERYWKLVLIAILILAVALRTR